jgi:hypothetical protein
VFGEYVYTDAEYDEQNTGTIAVPNTFPTRYWNSSNSQDYTVKSYFLGVRMQPIGRLRGEVKFGYASKDFKNEIDVILNRYADEDTWVADMSVQYMLLQNTMLSVNLQRTFLGTPDTTSTSYMDTKAGVKLTHKINRLTLRTGFDYNLNDYLNEAPGLPDKYFQLDTFTAGMDYRFSEWLTAGLDYQHQDKVASDDIYEVNEYIDDAFSFSADVIF